MRNLIIRVLSLVLAGAMFSGCAGGPKFGEVRAQLPQLAQSKGRIFFYRDRSPFGSAMQPQIVLNDEVVGKSQPGGFFIVDRPAGDYSVTCSTEVTKKLTFTLAANEKKYIRTRVNLGVLVGHVEPSLESEEEAIKTLEATSYTGDALSGAAK